MNSVLSNYARSAAPRSVLGRPLGRKDSQPRIDRGKLNAAVSVIHQEAMLSKSNNVGAGYFSESDKIEIARGLLKLQKQKRLLVWIGAEGIAVGEYRECLQPGEFRGRKIDWAKAAKIVDNPDRWLNEIVFGGKP